MSTGTLHVRDSAKVVTSADAFGICVGDNTPPIVRDGLVLWLDAKNASSYSGSGQMWYDLSEASNHFTMSPTGWTWNPTGSFTVVDAFASGPPSSAFGIDTEHTVEIVCQPTVAQRGFLYHLMASDNQNRMSLAHIPWLDNYVVYDVRGTPTMIDETMRIGYLPSEPLALRQYAMRTRLSQKPHRQIFESSTEKVNSADNETSSMHTWGGQSTIWNNTTNGIRPWAGHFYAMRIYNRALTDAELVQNYRNDKKRFELT